MKRVNFSEWGNSTPKDIMKRHKINPRQLEQQLSRETRGCSPQETKEIYKKVYNARD